MSASDQDNRIVEYLYGELEPAERVAFEQSLEADAELRAELESFRGTRAMMNSVVDEEPPQALFYELVREARKAASPEQRPSFIQQLMAALIRPQAATAMLVLIVAGTGLYLLDSNQHRIQEHPGDVVSPSALPTRSEMASAESVADEVAPAMAKLDKETGLGAALPTDSAADPSFASDLSELVAGNAPAKAPESEPSARGSDDDWGAGTAGRVASGGNVERKDRAVGGDRRRMAARAKKKRPLRKAKSTSDNSAPSMLATSKPRPTKEKGMEGMGVSAMGMERPAPKATKSKPSSIVYGGQQSNEKASQSALPRAEAPAAPASEAQEDEAISVVDQDKKPKKFDQAMTDYKAQRYGQAIAGFQRVLADKSLRNRVYTAKLHMARAYRKQGKLSQALNQYRTVLQAQQTRGQRHALLLETAQLEMNMGQLGVARSHVLQVLKGQKKPSPEASALLAQLDRRISEVDKKKAAKKAAPAKESKGKAGALPAKQK